MTFKGQDATVDLLLSSFVELQGSKRDPGWTPQEVSAVPRHRCDCSNRRRFSEAYTGTVVVEVCSDNTYVVLKEEAVMVSRMVARPHQQRGVSAVSLPHDFEPQAR